jgi:hypothetical protein
MPPRRRHLRPYKPLHRNTCKESEADFQYMQDLIDVDPRSLARHQTFSDLIGPPLMAAYFMKHFLCLEFLLQRGAKPDGLNCACCTTMNYALLDNNLSAIETLLKHGSDPNFNAGGGSYLSWAVDHLATDILLKYGAEPDDYSQNSFERNACYLSNLASSLIIGNLKTAKLFLLYGAITDYSKIEQVPMSGRFNNSFPHCVASIHHRQELKTVSIQKQMFYLLHQFGVNLYQENNLGLNVLQVLKFRAIGDTDSRELLDYLMMLLSEPLSLMSLARIATKNAIGRHYLKKIEMLENYRIIPKPLVPFLRFSEF